MTKLKEIDIEMIDDPETDIRTEIDLETIEDLSKSIEQIGLIQPITVFENRERYEVIVGHRRLIACREAGMKKIPAIVKEVKPEEIDIMKLDENVFREDVSATQIARYIYRIMTQRKLSTIEIARYFGKTPQWVNSMLRLLDTDEYTQKAVDKGELSYAAALELQKIEDEEKRKLYTQAAVVGGAHTRVVRSWVQEEQARARGEEIREIQTAEGAEESEPREYKQKCMLCGKLKPVGELITIQVDLKCYPQLREICKNYQEAEI